MIWAIKFLQKRPSDNTIRIWRIIFWLIISLWAYYSLIYSWRDLQESIMWILVTDSNEIVFKYLLVALGLIPLFMWITNICLLKSKYMRIVQIIFAFILFYASSTIVETADLWFDTLLWIMWIAPLIAWITWKCITKKCLRFWEKLTKIRV